ncbi:MAG TPA: hypothetical protein VFC82_10480 [Actinomycetaceae bacterium]|nr:hypothetical protein [Actinomycetaceae bacterium]
MSRQAGQVVTVVIPPAVLAIYLTAGAALGVVHDGPATSMSLLPWLFLLCLFGAVLEEAGWAGYATAPLVDRLGILGASAVIGVAWPGGF